MIMMRWPPHVFVMFILLIKTVVLLMQTHLFVRIMLSVVVVN